MALITRLSRLFKADMHAVLDRIEEPLQLLQQAVREMEAALQQEQQQLKLLQRQQGQLQRRRQTLQQQLEQGEEELDICFNSGKEALVRKLIKRRLESERLGMLLAQQEESLGEQIRHLDSQIAQHRSELEGMRQKAELLSTEQLEPRPGGSVEDIGVSVSDDEVEVAFLREQQRRGQS